MYFLFQTRIPDTVLIGIVAVSILLAVMTIVLMRVRTRPTPGGERQSPPFDPVLLGSAIAVIIMAGIAYLSL
jgi:hypothetical protein